jgi:hypothetical protein
MGTGSITKQIFQQWVLLIIIFCPQSGFNMKNLRPIDSEGDPGKLLSVN